MASLPESEIHGSPPDIRNQGKWHEILEKLLACTGASGAVVLLLNNDTLSCKATAGTTVPDLGTRLEQNTSITALCFRTGETLICEDSEFDTRVNTEACRVLHIRSLLAFALKRRNAVIGVLELLSRNPQTFGEQHIPLINRFAHQFLQLALADVGHEESSYKIEASDEPPEFLSRQTKEEFSKQEEQTRGAESLQLALENYEQRFASSRLPALVAATVTLTGLMILGLQLPTLWRSLRSLYVSQLRP